MALYRTYRPASFAEVVGQDHVTGPLSTALNAGRINHAYLFSGPRGCGKTSSARILAGYPRIGGSPDGGMTWTLPQLVGYEQAMRFLLENRTVDAAEALRLGIVSEVAEADDFRQRFHDYCQSLTKISPITARMTKRTLAKGQQTIDLEAQMRLEISSIGKCFGSDDGKEARKAFLEKRDPVFTGR
mgnify:CR=1 FL=1